MKVAPMGDVRNNFGKYLVVCEDEPVFVTKNGKITAVIEHVEDKDVEDFLLERSPHFRNMLNKVKRERGGMLLGLCAGIGAHLGYDPALIRLIFVLLAVLHYAGLAVILVYLLFALFVPYEPESAGKED